MFYVRDILKLVGCEMFCRKLLKLNEIPESHRQVNKFFQNPKRENFFGGFSLKVRLLPKNYFERCQLEIR